ncbi:DUF317 domain-containing protein [Streptomyces sp. NBRC 110611]|uniref:DUF317 domain-containing protein n=1 Tax=Streptomyces sp. NBRC 110611 TaxID=1621259 RepID=UPI000AE10A06|nr:DUF317 domain-containing protein [Streptomyces sp. NBRC 110611]
MKVLPRHLAGPGPLDPRTVWPFPFDEDWSLHQPAKGQAFATSPCLRLWTSLVLEPDSPSKGKWTIAANRVPFGPAAWQITFDATTPVELLHDVHTELLDLYHEDRHGDRDGLFEDETPPQEAYTPLLVNGWSHRVKTDSTQTFRAPEALGFVRHQYAATNTSRPAWTAAGGYPNEPHWRARFSFGAPNTLAAAFTASLISTEPVHRTVKDIPFHTRSHLYVAATTQATKQVPHSTPLAMPPATPAPGRTR